MVLPLDETCKGQERSQEEIEKLFRHAVEERVNKGDSLRFIVAEIQSLDLKDVRWLAYQIYFRSLMEPEEGKKIRYFMEAVQHSISINDVALEAECNHQIGLSYKETDQYDSAIFFYNKAVNLLIEDEGNYKSLFDAKKRLCSILGSFSAVYHTYGNYTRAIEYALWAERVAMDQGFQDQILTAMVNLAAIYGELSSPDNELGTASDRKRYETLARKYMIKSAKLAEVLGNLRSAGISNFNLGSFYSFQKNYDSSFLFLNKAIQIGNRLGFDALEINAYDNKSTNFMELSNLDSADYYAKKAIASAEQAGIPRLKSRVLISSGKVYAARGRLIEAENLFLEAVNIAEEIGNLRLAAQTYHRLHEFAFTKGNYKESLTYYKKHNLYQDSIINEANFGRIEELTVAYETEKKDRSIERLTQQNQIQDLEISKQRLWLFVSLTGVLGLILLALVFYILNKKRSAEQAKESEDLRQKLLRIQLNPHFTYNALNAIQSMVYENKDKQKTADYLSNFSSLMRNILELNQRDYITLEEELDFMENYIEVQQMRFDNPILYHLNVDDELAIETLVLPPMITQPFLENSFEHGFPDKAQNGNLWIDIGVEEDWLAVNIRDNGVGLSASGKKNMEHNSLATKITEERLANISMLFKRESGISIHELYEEGKVKGTEVIIKLPLIYD